jgi:hypothetical protein
VHGFQTFRLMVQPGGQVVSAHCLCDRLLPLSADQGRVELYRRQVVQILTTARFPAAEAFTEVTLPVLVGG